MSNVADDVIQIRNSLATMTAFCAQLSAKLDAFAPDAAPATSGCAPAIDLAPVLAAIAAIPPAPAVNLQPILDALISLGAEIKADVEPTAANAA